MTNAQRHERLTIMANIEDAITHLRPMLTGNVLLQADLALAACAVEEARTLLDIGDVSTVDGLLDAVMSCIDDILGARQSQQVGKTTAA